MTVPSGTGSTALSVLIRKRENLVEIMLLPNGIWQGIIGVYVLRRCSVKHGRR